MIISLSPFWKLGKRQPPTYAQCFVQLHDTPENSIKMWCVKCISLRRFSVTTPLRALTFTAWRTTGFVLESISFDLCLAQFALICFINTSATNSCLSNYRGLFYCTCCIVHRDYRALIHDQKCINWIVPFKIRNIVSWIISSYLENIESDSNLSIDLLCNNGMDQQLLLHFIKWWYELKRCF